MAEKKRIQLKPDPAGWIQRLLDTIPFREATLTHAVALMSRRIDVAHQDAADRFLAATAAVYGLTLLTADERLLHSHQFSTLAARYSILPSSSSSVFLLVPPYRFFVRVKEFGSSHSWNQRMALKRSPFHFIPREG